MARSRTIKPTFFTNEELAELPRDVRLFFIGLWGIADREGRLENRPKRIKREVFPYDDDVTTETVVEWLLVLANHKSRFVSLYDVDGERYIQVKNFKKHQDIHPRETQSEIPGPPKASLGLPKPEPAVARPEIIPLPSLPSCTSCTSVSLSSQVLEASGDPDRAHVERLPQECTCGVTAQKCPSPSLCGAAPAKTDAELAMGRSDTVANIAIGATETLAQRKPTGFDLLTWFGNFRREILKLQSAPGTERPKDPNGKASSFSESLTDDEIADVKPTMRLALERIRDSHVGWNDPRNVDPSFAFGSWKSGFAGLREAIHGIAPKMLATDRDGKRVPQPARY